MEIGITNDLIDFMHSTTREIEAEYRRIQKRSSEDPGTAGDQGELNWAKILSEWLPADYQVVTKGKLLNEKGMTSPQVDIIVLRPFYPRYLLDKKLYLTAGVAAVFECKNTLKNSHIDKVIQNSVKIRNLVDIKPSNYLNELNSPIIYGVLAHSHSWNKKGSKPLDNIESKLLEADRKYVNHPRECLDFILVSNLAVWSAYKLPMSNYSNNSSGKLTYGWRNGVQTAYGRSDNQKYQGESPPKFTPFGTFLTILFKRLAITDERLKNFSLYFKNTIDTRVSFKWRDWPDYVLSQETIQDLNTNRLTYQKEGFYKNM
ncbi:MAG: hypothetical protein RIE86_04925 [Imperialibacter sp.]|uniref:DUF6602 domain-containing protein n=1 Tax=Imperialibacter sp. TaxID=2038411 RepID=UPI0032EDF387